ncbi:G-protein coupled receptor 4 [Conger conger]|uniref:G-protein coupled receptor 4 n=1 Tax=Conger conger TaxID=82655 RepID=UPI002A5995DC|nr:G-protein coupled receptor 4 [Conger conger]
MTDFNYSLDNFASFLCCNPLTVIDIVTISIELPVLCWAVFVLYHQVKTGYVIPVYVINLLISDFIQIIGRIFYDLSMILILPEFYPHEFGRFLFMLGIFASIGFMVCIALERYLLVVHPLWYRCHHTIKHSILLSLAVWLSLVLFLIGFVFGFWADSGILFAFIIIPFLLLLFFLGAIWRALSHSISVPHKEKKRILGTLALILLIYIVMFCPSILLIVALVKVSGSEESQMSN